MSPYNNVGIYMSYSYKLLFVHPYNNARVVVFLIVASTSKHLKYPAAGKLMSKLQ